MSRSGYHDDCDDNWALIRYRGAVASALSGHRGQAFLRELLEALDAMPDKKLIAHELVSDGCVCALGAVAAIRGINTDGLDPENAKQVSRTFGIAEAMAREIVFENDEGDWETPFDSFETPEQRWTRMRAWVVSNLRRVAA